LNPKLVYFDQKKAIFEYLFNEKLEIPDLLIDNFREKTVRVTLEIVESVAEEAAVTEPTITKPTPPKEWIQVGKKYLTPEGEVKWYSPKKKRFLTHYSRDIVMEAYETFRTTREETEAVKKIAESAKCAPKTARDRYLFIKKALPHLEKIFGVKPPAPEVEVSPELARIIKEKEEEKVW
jgi:hypothetical protein